MSELTSGRSPGNVACFDDDAEYNAFWAATIELSSIDATGNFTDPSETDALLAQADVMQQKYEELGARCQKHSSGKYLKYMGTAATVRDLLAMADALDGPGGLINYLGLSYGTILGSWLGKSEFRCRPSMRYLVLTNVFPSVPRSTPICYHPELQLTLFLLARRTRHT